MILHRSKVYLDPVLPWKDHPYKPIPNQFRYIIRLAQACHD